MYLELSSKPQPVVAILWTGENEEEVTKFLQNGNQYSAAGYVKGRYVEIGTAGGLRVASIGHYIVRTETNDFFPKSLEALLQEYDITKGVYIDDCLVD